MDMISKIVENSKKHVEASRAALQAERDKMQKERAVALRDVLKKEESQIQQQIEEVKRQIAERGMLSFTCASCSRFSFVSGPFRFVSLQLRLVRINFSNYIDYSPPHLFRDYSFDGGT
jgi:repressor of nif and glnA expression